VKDRYIAVSTGATTNRKKRAKKGNRNRYCMPQRFQNRASVDSLGLAAVVAGTKTSGLDAIVV
jgi:hypothetical protein